MRGTNGSCVIGATVEALPPRTEVRGDIRSKGPKIPTKTTGSLASVSEMVGQVIGL